jgi:hypothetical protein
MVQILEENHRPSTAQKFAKAFQKGSESLSQSVPQLLMQRENQQQNQQRAQQRSEYIKQLTGQDVPEEFHADILKNHLQGRGAQDLQAQKFANEMQLQEQKHGLESNKEQQKLDRELNEKLAPFQGALETINAMRQIKSKENIGRGSALTGIFNEDIRKDRAKYSQLGKSLIQMASTIPIRNQREFDTLAEDLIDPSRSVAEIEGTLDAMEQIIRQNMQQYSSGMDNQQQQMPKEQNQNRPPLSSFNR